jgi:hypothetical protein
MGSVSVNRARRALTPAVVRHRLFENQRQWLGTFLPMNRSAHLLAIVPMYIAKPINNAAKAIFNFRSESRFANT